MAKRLRASPLRNFAHERFQTHEWASSGHGVAGTIADIFSSAKWRRAARAKGFACVRLSIDDMPNSWFSSQSASSTPLHIYANHAPSTPNVACNGGLADDFAHARQTAVGTSACRPGPAAPTRVRARHDERQLVARRPAPLQVSNEATATPSIRRVVDDSVSRTEQIYTALRDDVALPALRRFERLHRFRASPGNGDTGRASEDRPNPVWFDNLQPHLRVEAQILSRRGLDAAQFRQRLEGGVEMPGHVDLGDHRDAEAIGQRQHLGGARWRRERLRAGRRGARQNGDRGKAGYGFIGGWQAQSLRRLGRFSRHSRIGRPFSSQLVKRRRRRLTLFL